MATAEKGKHPSPACAPNKLAPSPSGSLLTLDAAEPLLASLLFADGPAADNFAMGMAALPLPDAVPMAASVAMADRKHGKGMRYLGSCSMLSGLSNKPIT